MDGLRLENRNREISMRRSRSARLILLALSLALARPAQADEVFTSVESEACDYFGAQVKTHGNWVNPQWSGWYCDLPGDFVHWPDTTYFADGTPDGRLYTWVGVEGTTRTWNTLASVALYQGASAHAAGYVERSVEGANSLEMTISLTVDALTASAPYESGSSLEVVLVQIPQCSDGSNPVFSGSGHLGLHAGDVEVAPGPRRVVQSATCPAGSTMTGIVRTAVWLASGATAWWSTYVHASGAVRVHSVELTTR
jgi:hypothetical protein